MLSAYYKKELCEMGKGHVSSLMASDELLHVLEQFPHPPLKYQT